MKNKHRKLLILTIFTYFNCQPMAEHLPCSRLKPLTLKRSQSNVASLKKNQKLQAVTANKKISEKQAKELSSPATAQLIPPAHIKVENAISNEAAQSASNKFYEEIVTLQEAMIYAQELIDYADLPCEALDADAMEITEKTLIAYEHFLKKNNDPGLNREITKNITEQSISAAWKKFNDNKKKTAEPQ